MSAAEKNVGRLCTFVLKLARINPRLIKNTPDNMISCVCFVRAMIGLTKILPLHVNPVPNVPTNETKASWPCASVMLDLSDV